MRHWLSGEDVADLTWIWNVAESATGLHSGQGAILFRLETGDRKTSGAVPDGLPDRSEYDRMRAMRVEASVRRLRDVPDGLLHQRALWAVYGVPRRAEWACSRLGEIALIAPYTKRAIEAAEEDGLSVAQSLERRVRGKGADSFLSVVVRQCERLLENASRAYVAVRETRHAAQKRRAAEGNARHAAMLRGEMLGDEVAA